MSGSSRPVSRKPSFGNDTKSLGIPRDISLLTLVELENMTGSTGGNWSAAVQHTSPHRITTADCRRSSPAGSPQVPARRPCRLPSGALQDCIVTTTPSLLSRPSSRPLTRCACLAPRSKLDQLSTSSGWALQPSNCFPRA